VAAVWQNQKGLVKKTAVTPLLSPLSLLGRNYRFGISTPFNPRQIRTDFPMPIYVLFAPDRQNSDQSHCRLVL
jgi:hypothetical protein